MMIKQIYFFLCLLFAFNSVIAQGVKTSPFYPSFWDYQNDEPVIILNDSTILYGKNLKQKTIPKFNLDDSHLNELIPTHINDKTYLFDRAGGVVVEYSDHEFKRDDKSFTHKNQYYSAYFTYNNEIYLLGGYGLFTDKNILTKYDFIAKEWFLIDTQGAPEFITSDLFTVIGHKLYFINKGNNAVIKLKHTVYELDLNTFKFKLLGTTSFKKHQKYLINQLQDGRLIIIINRGYNKILDFKNNLLLEVEMKYPVHPHSNLIKYDSITHTYNLKTENFGKNMTRFDTVKDEDLEYRVLKQQQLYKPVHQNLIQSLTYGTCFMALLGLSFYSYKRYKNFNKLNINLTTKKISFKGKVINRLSDEEIDLLIRLAEADDYIDYSDILNYHEKNMSYESQKKKRQLLISQLQEKLKFYIKDEANQLFLFKKSKEDKRYKIIKLNTDILVIEG